MWVFGGFDDQTEDGCIGALAAYDLAAERWEAVTPSGAPPGPRLGQTASSIRRSALVEDPAPPAPLVPI